MVLETKRLRLREAEEQDFGTIKRLLQDDRVMDSHGGRLTDWECMEWVQRQKERWIHFSYGLWAVEIKETEQMIGLCGLIHHLWKGHDILDLVYLFDPNYWAMGFGTEAAMKCKAFAFDILMVNELYSMIRDINEYAQIISVRLGMEVVDRMTETIRGQEKPQYLYRVKRTF